LENGHIPPFRYNAVVVYVQDAVAMLGEFRVTMMRIDAIAGRFEYGHCEGGHTRLVKIATGDAGRQKLHSQRAIARGGIVNIAVARFPR